MSGGMRPDSGTGVLLSAEERREVLGRLRGGLYNRAKDIGWQFNMERRMPGKEEFNEMMQYFRNKLKKLEMGGEIRVELGTNIMYGDMERLRSSSSSASGGGEG